MRPAYYFNVRVATEATARGPAGFAIDVIAKLLKAVHAICEQKKIQFASAFPQARNGDHFHPGTVLRVFVETRDAADDIGDALEANTFLAGYIHVGRIRVSPLEGVSSVSYERFRISSRKSVKPEHRLRRLAEGDSLPYLKIASASNGEGFSLRFKVVQHSQAPSSEIEPNGYGLSVSTRSFRLPEINDDTSPWAKQI